MPSHHYALSIALLGFLLLLAACGGGGSSGSNPMGYGEFPLPNDPGGTPAPPPDPGGGNPPPPPGLEGGVLVTVDTGGEIWHWWVTNPVTASYLERAWNGNYTGRFHGTLRGGQGAANHNAPWSWHVDPNDNGHDIVFFAPPSPGEPTTPSQCENNLPVWLSRHTLFIANPFTLVAFEDYR